MGAIQNSINQMLGTVAGAVTLGTHLSQQAEGIKEQEATRKLAGANAAAAAQSQLNEINASLDKGIEEWGNASLEAGKARANLTEEQQKSGNLTTDKSGRTRTVDPKTGKMGPWYSTKALEKAKTALQEADATRIGYLQNVQRLYQQRLSVLAKSQKINEVYGEKIVDIPGVGAENLEAALKKYPELFEKGKENLNYETRRREIDEKDNKFKESK